MTFVESSDSEGSGGDLSGNAKGGNHTGEIEGAMVATDYVSSPDLEGGSHTGDEAKKDDGSETPEYKMSCTCTADDDLKCDEKRDRGGGVGWQAGLVHGHEEAKDCGGVLGTAKDKDRDGVPGTGAGTAKGKDGDGVVPSAGAAKGKDGDALPFDRERANRNAALLLSLLLVAAMPVVILRSVDQPLLVVWRLSVLLSCCCSIWARLLAVSTRSEEATLHRYRMALGFVLALYVDAAVDPKLGVLIAHLNSHLAAGALGHALAERRERDGAEVSAAAVPVVSDEKQAEYLLGLQVIGGAYFGLITLGIAAAVAWVVFHAADFPAEQLVMFAVSIPLAGALVMWITFVGGMLLQGALIADTGFAILIMYLTFSVLIYVWCVMAFGDLCAMIVMWLLVLGLSGFFGYSLRVYASYSSRLDLER